MVCFYIIEMNCHNKGIIDCINEQIRRLEMFDVLFFQQYRPKFVIPDAVFCKSLGSIL